MCLRYSDNDTPPPSPLQSLNSYQSASETSGIRTSLNNGSRCFVVFKYKKICSLITLASFGSLSFRFVRHPSSFLTHFSWIIFFSIFLFNHRIMEMTPLFPRQKKYVLTSSGNVFALPAGMRMSSTLLHVAHSLSRKPNTPLLFICDLNSRETVKISCKGRIGRGGKRKLRDKVIKIGRTR